MDPPRRLSQAISEGDSISVLVEIGDGDTARAAADHGAEGLVVRAAVTGVRAATSLPVLQYGGAPGEWEADAVVISAAHDDDHLDSLVGAAETHGMECVFEVRDEEELERLLEVRDPEVLLLTAITADDDQTALDRVLELLEDVPAGKLAVAVLDGLAPGDLDVLERAGMDAVLVGAHDLSALAGEHTITD